MRRDVTWNERLPDRTKREVSVKFFGGKLFWNERLSNDSPWSDEMTPSEEDWDRLRKEIENRMQRGRAKQEDLDAVLKRNVGARRGRPRQQSPGPG